MSDTARAAFDALREWEDAHEEFLLTELREAEEMERISIELEDELSATGLRFTKPFHGGLPVQAFGWIFGERFHFRFRHDTATLTVGTVNPVKAQEAFERKVERMMNTEKTFPTFQNRDLEPGHFSREAVIDRFNLRVENDFSVDAFPNDVSDRASIENFLGVALLGVLEPEQAKDAFTRLVEKLQASRDARKAV